MKKILNTTIFTVLFGIIHIPSIAQQMVKELTISPFYLKQISLTAGVPVSLETRNLSANADPIMYLIYRGKQVAYNDDFGRSHNSRINYTPAATGNYYIIIRSKTPALRGTASVYRNNLLLSKFVEFAGSILTLDNLRNMETIELVKQPKGADGMLTFFILGADGTSITDGAIPIGAEFTGQYYVRANLGARRILVGSDGQTGKVRLIRNDANLPGHDTDNDGLGNELENEIGTCSTLSGLTGGFDCSLAADPRDTDGDGISDADEVFGRRNLAPTLPLAKWGADPRHKDLFIQVDFMRRTKLENINLVTDKMKISTARQFAKIYADAFTTDHAIQLTHARLLRNPDQLPGINLHLDIGVAPETPDDATIYGDWGGFSAVNAIQSNGQACNMSTLDNDCHGQNPSDIWQQRLSPLRIGVFRYALGYSTGGGSCGQGFACAFNFHDDYNPAHEWGHTMGLGHSGPDHATGNIDPNCKPNYGSIMNYAFYGQPETGFADGTGLPPLNNAALKEWKAVPPTNTVYLDVLERVFGYWVDRENGHVDWNRNGVFESEGQTVKAYANYRPGNACEFTRYNQSEIPGASTTTTPVLARLGNRLYMFYAKDGALKYKYSTSSWDCPQPVPTGCANGSWSNEYDARMQSVGVDVCNDGISLRVISVEWNGRIMEKRLMLIAGNESWTQANQIPGSAQGNPSVSYGLTGSFLLYKGTDLLIHFNRLVAGQWQVDQKALSAEDIPLKSTDQWAFPTIIQTFLPWKPGVKGLYALIPAPDAKLDLWYFNPATNFWELTNLMEGDRVGPIFNKPSMAYVPYYTERENPGRLYVVYINQSHPGVVFDGVVRMKMSYVKVTSNSNGTFSKDEKIGLDSYFDNQWFYSYGINLYYDPLHDTNLRAVCTAANGESKFQISFRPKADGINDFSYTNYDDWEYLRVNLCKTVVNPGGLVDNPIGCPLHP